MFLGAGLDQQLKIPEFGAFFWTSRDVISKQISKYTNNTIHVYIYI